MQHLEVRCAVRPV